MAGSFQKYAVSLFGLVICGIGPRPRAEAQKQKDQNSGRQRHEYHTYTNGQTDGRCDLQTSGGRQAMNTVALVQDGTCAKEADAVHDLRCDARWITCTTKSV